MIKAKDRVNAFVKPVCRVGLKGRANGEGAGNVDYGEG